MSADVKKSSKHRVNFFWIIGPAHTFLDSRDIVREYGPAAAMKFSSSVCFQKAGQVSAEAQGALHVPAAPVGVDAAAALRAGVAREGALPEPAVGPVRLWIHASLLSSVGRKTQT